MFAVEPVALDPRRSRALFDAIVADQRQRRPPRRRSSSTSCAALPVHAVGEATAAAAREAGFTRRHGRRRRRARRSAASARPRLLHLAGARPLPVGGAIEAVAVYASRAIDPPPVARGASPARSSPSIRPRAGRRLAELVERSLSEPPSPRSAPPPPRPAATAGSRSRIAARAERGGASGPRRRLCESRAATMTAPNSRRHWTRGCSPGCCCCCVAGAALATWGLADGRAPRNSSASRPRPPAVRACARRRRRWPWPRRPRPIRRPRSRIADLEGRLRRGRDRHPPDGGIGRARRRLAGRLRRAPGDRSRRGARLSRDPARRRFGADLQRAVATIVTASREPVTLDQLIADYRALGPALRARRARRRPVAGVPARDGLAGRDPPRQRAVAEPQARYERALGAARSAARSTPRWPRRCACPGAARAEPWVAKARRYVAAHRALDEIESGGVAGRRPLKPVRR